MSRLHRGLWFVHATRPDGTPFLTQPAEYEVAAVEAPQLGGSGIAIRAILRHLPGSRARWEYLAPFEASDRPQWGETR